MENKLKLFTALLLTSIFFILNPADIESKSKNSLLFSARIGNKTGYINIKGKTVIPFKYSYASPFSNDLARVSYGNKYGYIDRNGTLVIPMEYSHGGHFNEGYAAVKKGSRYGLIDKNNRVIIPFIYDASTGSYDEGLVGFKKDGKWAYFNIKHEMVIPYRKAFTASSFNDGIASIGGRGKYGAIDKNGKLILPIKYDYPPQCSEGRILAKLNGKNGYYDKKGNLVIPHKYRWAKPFSQGFAFVGTGKFKSGENGLINTKGKFIHVFKSSAPYVATYFSDGLILVRNLRKNPPNNNSFMDKNGKIKLQFTAWGFGQAFKDGFIIFAQKKSNNSYKWGVINTSGKIIIPAKYDFISW